jgi:hypothetical protein
LTEVANAIRHGDLASAALAEARRPRSRPRLLRLAEEVLRRYLGEQQHV